MCFITMVTSETIIPYLPLLQTLSIKDLGHLGVPYFLITCALPIWTSLQVYAVKIFWPFRWLIFFFLLSLICKAQLLPGDVVIALNFEGEEVIIAEVQRCVILVWLVYVVRLFMQSRDSIMSSNDKMSGHTVTMHTDDSDLPTSSAIFLHYLVARRDGLTFTPLLRRGGEQPASLNNDSLPNLVDYD